MVIFFLIKLVSFSILIILTLECRMQSANAKRRICKVLGAENVVVHECHCALHK